MERLLDCVLLVVLSEKRIPAAATDVLGKQREMFAREKYIPYPDQH